MAIVGRGLGPCQTKPISGPVRAPGCCAGGGTHVYEQSQFAESRASPGVVRLGGCPVVRNKANSPQTGRQGCCWGQACETKPISSERGERQEFCGRGVMTNWTRRRPWRNKPNLPPHGQAEPSLGPVVQTKPISRHRQRWARAARPWSSRWGQACQTKPILPRAEPSLGAVVQTNPISTPAKGRGGKQGLFLAAIPQTPYSFRSGTGYGGTL
jgi:hypothetical protein